MLGDILVLVEGVAARHLGTVTTLIHCVLDLVVGMGSSMARARQGHGGSSKKEGRDEELHFDGFWRMWKVIEEGR